MKAPEESGVTVDEMMTILAEYAMKSGELTGHLSNMVTAAEDVLTARDGAGPQVLAAAFSRLTDVWEHAAAIVAREDAAISDLLAELEEGGEI